MLEAMREVLKKGNRTLLEMHLGILFWGVACQAVGAFFAKDQGRYAASLWFGILFAAVSAYQMYRSLDRALDYDEKTVTKLIFRGYLLRYVFAALILGMIMVTDVLDALVVFLAYMSLKVAAYLQPFTHKLCNKLFHETDPVAMPLEEDDLSSLKVSEQISSDKEVK